MPERLRPAMRAFDHRVVQMLPQRIQRVVRIADVTRKRPRTGPPQILIGDRRVDIFLAALFKQPQRDTSIQQPIHRRALRPLAVENPQLDGREHGLRSPERFDQIENRRRICMHEI